MNIRLILLILPILSVQCVYIQADDVQLQRSAYKKTTNTLGRRYQAMEQVGTQLSCAPNPAVAADVLNELQTLYNDPGTPAAMCCFLIKTITQILLSNKNCEVAKKVLDDLKSSRDHHESSDLPKAISDAINQITCAYKLDKKSKYDRK